jgi:hypothetical protein
MSEDKNTPPKEEPTKETPTESPKIKVSVERSKEVDSLHEELERVKAELKAAKDLGEAEKKTLSDDKTRIENELKEKRAILEQQALAELEKVKAEILDMAKKGKLTDEQINEIEAKLEKPQNVTLVKDLVTMMVSTIKETPPPPKEPPKTPSGKAPIIPPTSGGGDEFNTSREIIDDIYRKIQFPTQYTKEEVEEAKKNRDKLLTAMIKGKSWEQLRAGQGMKTFKIRNCPNCSGTIIGEIPDLCPYCKFKLSKTGDIRAEEQRR